LIYINSDWRKDRGRQAPFWVNNAADRFHWGAAMTI
jgi:hypothetical protein